MIAITKFTFGDFVSITFFAQTNEQNVNAVFSETNVMLVTEIHFFRSKCQLSHSPPKASSYCFLDFLGEVP